MIRPPPRSIRTDTLSLHAALPLASEAAHRLQPLLILVTVRFANRPLDQREHLVVHVKAGKLLRERLRQGFFAHIFFRAFLLESRAVIIDVPAPLHLCHDRAATMSAGDQARKSKSQRLGPHVARAPAIKNLRSEEHTSELQSLMRISYAVFCF